MQKYSKTYTVKSYECDTSGRLRVRSLFNLLQDMADDHADRMGVGYHYCKEHQLGWVGAGYELQIDQWPVFEETLTIETWPSAALAASGIRDFYIRSNQGLIARASSRWVVLDTVKMRPVPIAKHMPAYELLQERAIQTDFKQGIELTREDACCSFSVHEDELDLNGHVNNAVYSAWILDTLPEDFIKTHEMAALRILFKTPALRGDKVCIKTQLEKNQTRHLILNAQTDRTFALIEVHWRPCSQAPIDTHQAS